MSKYALYHMYDVAIDSDSDKTEETPPTFKKNQTMTYFT